MAEGMRVARWRRPVLIAGAVAVAMLAGHGAAWWWVTGQIEAGWPGGVAAAKSYGWDITGGAPTRGGWPWMASVQRVDVVATRPLGAATLRIQFERLEVAVSPIDLHALRAEALGPVVVSVGDGAVVTLRAASAVLRAPLDGPAALAVRTLEVADSQTHGFAISKLDILLEGMAARVSASGIEGRPPLPPPFETGGGVSFRIATTLPFPLAATPAASVAQWQAAGGKITLPVLAVRWGQLTVDGHAEGGLDAALQPQAQGTLDTQGAAALLDAAAKAGAVTRPVAQATHAVLSILALSAQGGAIRLPFRLSDGTLTVAQFPLAAIPRLDWGSR